MDIFEFVSWQRVHTGRETKAYGCVAPRNTNWHHGNGQKRADGGRRPESRRLVVGVEVRKQLIFFSFFFSA